MKINLLNVLIKNPPTKYDEDLASIQFKITKTGIKRCHETQRAFYNKLELGLENNFADERFVNSSQKTEECLKQDRAYLTTTNAQKFNKFNVELRTFLLFWEGVLYV